ncbi:MAG: hypothetical protein IBX57_00545 [Gammaproteobacteria bacterium]|nr:hypothetical protein [Gammaproteobacteria bacterium]
MERRLNVVIDDDKEVSGKFDIIARTIEGARNVLKSTKMETLFIDHFFADGITGLELLLSVIRQIKTDHLPKTIVFISSVDEKNVSDSSTLVDYIRRDNTMYGVDAVEHGKNVYLGNGIEVKASVVKLKLL